LPAGLPADKQPILDLVRGQFLVFHPAGPTRCTDEGENVKELNIVNGSGRYRYGYVSSKL